MINEKQIYTQIAEQTPALSADQIPEEFLNAMENILIYSDIARDKAELFKQSVQTYFNRNGERSNSESLKARDSVISLFFEIYPEVAKKTWHHGSRNDLYDAFLKYSFMDERLLKPEQLIVLGDVLIQETQSEEQSISVYYLSDWLKLIYEQQVNPSVNEYEQDYFDVFRERKKKGQLSEKDRSVYERDLEGRLRHEVDNLFKMGQRLCYGRTRGYFPIICSETIGADLSRSLITPTAIVKSLQKIINIDFSAFYREAVYHDNNGPNPMTYIIMKSAMPDIILLPTFGSRGVMWQEIAGRVKTSAARFIFPIFTDENLDNLMLNVVAKFRWELAKNVSGSLGNRAFDKSLYSEYTDYIQTYKKNRNLSTDMKEKIRVQIDRKRNHVGEIFAEDYATWISYESRGMLRLNKVVRGILFKYCPFAKSIRDLLITNPQYNQIITQYNYGSSKMSNIWEAKTSKMPQPIDNDLMDNLMYYKM